MLPNSWQSCQPSVVVLGIPLLEYFVDVLLGLRRVNGVSFVRSSHGLAHTALIADSYPITFWADGVDPLDAGVLAEASPVGFEFERGQVIKA